MRNYPDELLDRAFRLAYFIHREREIAMRITEGALENLETITERQDKRRYYLGRRTKVSFTEFHLLQLLVYEKSTPFEKVKERDLSHPPNDQRLLVHFLKHLVWLMLGHRSLYVALGLCQLLHRYTTAETMELYNLITQDPDQVPTEDYCRSRKKVLMEEMLARFGSLLRTAKGPRGTVRFVTHDHSAGFSVLVDGCLAAFTPWKTICHVPDGFSPSETTLPEFCFDGDDPDGIHQVEIRRFHALLHPECLSRLLRALGLASTAERLEIPRFHVSHREENDDPPADDDADAGEFLNSDREELARYLRNRERDRKKVKAEVLRLFANGDELAQLDLRQKDRVRFRLLGYAAFLEIRADERHGNLLLATHRLNYDDDGRLSEQDIVIVLQNDQRLALRVSPSGAGVAPLVEVSKVEIGWLRRLQTGLESWRLADAKLAPAYSSLAVMAIVLFAVSSGFGLFWYREWQNARTARQTLAQIQMRQQAAVARMDQLMLENREAQARLQAAEQVGLDAERRVLQLQAQLNSKPDVPNSLTNVYVEPLRLANLKGAGDGSVLTVPDSTQTILLLIEINRPLAYSSYAIEIRDSSGNLVSYLTGLDPKLTRENRLSVALSRSALQAGDYHLRLFGQKGSEKTDLGEYPLQLRFQR